MTELGLSRGEFAKRLGHKNLAKGIRRIDALCEGDETIFGRVAAGLADVS